MINRIFKTLYGRLALILLCVFLTFGLLCAVLLVQSSRNYQKEVSQQMHQDLAQHVVDTYVLFKDGSPDLEVAKKTFHDLMILGPNFEFYLLDATGKILAYSADPTLIKREQVNIAVFNGWKQKLDINGVVAGEDPRGFESKKVFSVASIMQGSTVAGYLYVIVGSQIQDGLEHKLWASKILTLGLIVFISGFIFTALILLFLIKFITQPLSILTKKVTKIRQLGFENNNQAFNALVSDLGYFPSDTANDIHMLGYTFKLALEKLQQQYTNIVSIDDLRKELLAHVSHDLRTPLASLLGYLETWEIQREQLTSAQSFDYISIARRNAQKISTLIEQLFELAHLDGSNVQVNIEPIAIAELIQDVLQKFKISAQEKNITLAVTPHDSGIQVRADVEKLDRVFTNLIENAMRHTKVGGKIEVQIKPEPTKVAIYVIDNGIGIPEKDLPFIFDAHFKAGNSIRENTAHGGLGLAITKKLLNLHQSAIAVKSQLDKGTTFTFTLPCA